MKLKSFCLPCLINLISQYPGAAEFSHGRLLQADVTEMVTESPLSWLLLLLVRCQEMPPGHPQS